MANVKPESVSSAFKPTLYLNEKELPEIKDWKPGQEYDLILRAKMVQHSANTESPIDGKKTKNLVHSARFEVLSVESPKGNEPINEEDFTSQKISALERKAKQY